MDDRRSNNGFRPDSRQESEKAAPPSRALLRPRILLGNPFSTSGPAGLAAGFGPLRVLMQDKGSAYGGGADRQACHGFRQMGALMVGESNRLLRLREGAKPTTVRHNVR